ncbi:MAG: hypothetical protein JO314_00825 [Acidobacteria bacterium]|nr:hypothetical protein [Acidobacteriota bacterium]
MIDFKRVWTSLSLDEKIAFRDRAIKAVQEIYPHYIVRPLSPGDAERFFVGNKQENVRAQVPLRDLFARYSISGKTHDGLKEAIFSEYTGVLNHIEDASLVAEEPDLSWNDIKDVVRLQHVRNEQIPAGKLHLPFGDEVASAYVIDRPREGLMYWVTDELRETWGVTAEDLLKLSMENLAHLADGMDFAGLETPHQELWNHEGLPFASTCLLIAPIRYLIAQTIGSPYRFGIPSRHRFYAWTDIEDEKFQIEMRAKMQREMDRYPSPLTSKIYEVDTQGQIKLIKPQPEVPQVPLISNN